MGDLLMKLKKSVFLFVLLSSMPGILDSASAAIGYPVNYDCKLTRSSDDYDPTTFELILKSKDQIEIVTDEARESGELDSDYVPRSSSQRGSQRYFGSFVKTLGEGVDGYSLSIILNRYLARGSDFGLVALRFTGEGFFQYQYRCEIK